MENIKNIQVTNCDFELSNSKITIDICDTNLNNIYTITYRKDYTQKPKQHFIYAPKTDFSYSQNHSLLNVWGLNTTVKGGFIGSSEKGYMFNLESSELINLVSNSENTLLMFTNNNIFNENKIEIQIVGSVNENTFANIINQNNKLVICKTNENIVAIPENLLEYENFEQICILNDPTKHFNLKNNVIGRVKITANNALSLIYKYLGFPTTYTFPIIEKQAPQITEKIKSISILGKTFNIS